jgi:hypothetical protein
MRSMAQPLGIPRPSEIDKGTHWLTVVLHQQVLSDKVVKVRALSRVDGPVQALSQ